MLAFAVVNLKTNEGLKMDSPYFRLIGATAENSASQGMNYKFYPMHACSTDEFNMLWKSENEKMHS